MVVGARFDDRATGKLSEFAPFARVIHLDADAYEISKLRTADIAVPGDVATSLKALSAARANCQAGARAVLPTVKNSVRATTRQVSISTPRRC